MRLASDPNLYNIPAINYPIGHELTEVDSVEEAKELKPVLVAAKPVDELPTRDELVSYACELTGLPDAGLMKTALYETFGKENVPFVTVIEMIQVITQIYEANEAAKFNDDKECKESGKSQTKQPDDTKNPSTKL